MNARALAAGQLDIGLQDRYWQDGFLHPITVMDAAEAAAIRSEFETLEAEWRAADLPLPLNSYLRVNAHCVLPLAARLALDPRVLDVIEGVLGPR